MKKYRGLTGYTLHKKRLDYSFNTINARKSEKPKEANLIRSIKLPLLLENDSKDDLQNLINVEYRNLFGSISVIDYLDNPGHYSLVDFWLDSMRLGIVFAGSTAGLSDYIHPADTNLGNDFYRSFFGYLDYDVFKKQVIQNTGFRKGLKTNQIIVNTYKKIFKKEFQDLDIVKNEIEIIVKEIQNKNAVEQGQFWFFRYGIITASFKNEDSFKKESLTCVFCLDLKVDMDLSPHEIIDRLSLKFPDHDISILSGVGANANALSNYFNKVIKEIKKENGEIWFLDAMLSIFPVLESNKAELKTRIKLLQSCALKMSNPVIADAWADYRSMFGGRMTSWLSNIKGKLEKQTIDIEKEIEKLHKLESHDLDFVSLHRGDYKNIKSFLLSFVNNFQKKYTYEDSIIYRNLSGEWNTLCNNYILKTYGELENDERDKKGKPYILSDIQATPEFPSTQKRIIFEKFKNSVKIFKNYLHIQESIFSEINNSINGVPIIYNEEITIRKIQTLINIYRRLTSTKIKHIVLGELKKIGIDENFLVEQKNVVWKSSRSRDTRLVIMKIPKINLLNMYEIANNLHILWNNIDINSQFQDAIDAIEIEKFRSGIFGILDITIKINKIDSIPEANMLLSYLSLYTKNNKYSTNVVNNGMQKFIFSEMRGVISMMSKKYIIHRSVLLLVGESRKLYGIHKLNNRWYIKYHRENDGIDKNVENIQLLGSPSYLGILYNNEFEQYKDIKKKNIEGYSIISEIELEFKWENDKVGYNKIESKANKIYINIPCKISAQNKEKQQRQRIMGIDVGEYGIAYTILDQESKKILKTGFIFEPAIKNIKEYRKELKTEQSKGTFSVSTTKLARLREHAITNIRNKIHDLVIRFNAIPVYERQISNFETGDGKVTQIYNSVKRADVSSKIKAEEAETNLVWGNKYLNPGVEISAYGTSYCCVSCFKSVYDTVDLSDEDFKNKRNYARAPVHVILNKSEFDADCENIRKSRGNSTLFRCPFCENIADADVQASYAIALKYLYFQTLTELERKAKAKDRSFKLFLDFYEIYSKNNIDANSFKLVLVET